MESAAGEILSHVLNRRTNSMTRHGMCSINAKARILEAEGRWPPETANGVHPFLTYSSEAGGVQQRGYVGKSSFLLKNCLPTGEIQ